MPGDPLKRPANLVHVSGAQFVRKSGVLDVAATRALENTITTRIVLILTDPAIDQD